MSSQRNLKPAVCYSLKNWVGHGISGSTVTPQSWVGSVSRGMLSGCPDCGGTWTRAVGLHAVWLGWKEHSPRVTDPSEGTASRLGFLSWYVLLMSAAPSLTATTERAGRLVMGKWIFISTPWALRVLSPPSYVQLRGTAISVDTDLAPEPPVPLSVWHREVCAAACPFLQHLLDKKGRRCGQESNVSSCCFKAS